MLKTLFKLASVEVFPFRALIRALFKRFYFGLSLDLRFELGVLERQHYAYVIHEAASLARRLGYPRISIVEFGVAGGRGLLFLETYAEWAEKKLGVQIEIYGFDTGSGLPEPLDYRDLPYHWRRGFYAMNKESLLDKLRRSKLILGNVDDTVKTFIDIYKPAPVGAVLHDMDFYSSTVSSLTLFRESPKFLMPRVFCYFDDTIGSAVELYSEYTGQRLAIKEFNEKLSQRKFATPFYLRVQQARGIWVNQIWILHIFDHPDYNRFISQADQQLPL